MAQLFPRWLNKLPLIGALVAPLVGAIAVGGVWYYGSPEYTDVGYAPEQPVPYSHALHVGELGIDCLYCHVSVEHSPVANIPPTQTCMNCHSLVTRDSPLLEPIRDSLANQRPMQWDRVHDLADYAFFNHSMHVRAGVGCVSCHGQINEMEVVYQAEPLSMGWCLDCHRNPGPHLRPVEEVTNMEWFPPRNHDEFVEATIREKGIAPPVDCSGCHH